MIIMIGSCLIGIQFNFNSWCPFFPSSFRLPSVLTKGRAVKFSLRITEWSFLDNNNDGRTWLSFRSIIYDELVNACAVRAATREKKKCKLARQSCSLNTFSSSFRWCRNRRRLVGNQETQLCWRVLSFPLFFASVFPPPYSNIAQLARRNWCPSQMAKFWIFKKY